MRFLGHASPLKMIDDRGRAMYHSLIETVLGQRTQIEATGLAPGGFAHFSGLHLFINYNSL